MKLGSFRYSSRALFLALLLTACDSSNNGGSGDSDGGIPPRLVDAAVPGPMAPPSFTEPGTKTAPSLSAADQAQLSKLSTELKAVSALTGPELLAKRSVTFASALGYDPRAAKNLDLIQASALRLDEAELAKLSAQGFVITPRNKFPNMINGYKTIYAEDLPVYISLDSILDAVHVSYDAILKSLEQSQLSKDLAALLTGALSKVGDPALPATTAKDLDVYFSVAISLLNDSVRAPHFKENEAQVRKLFEAGKAASGIQAVTLFGSTRDYDFSQLKPRGHYTDTYDLEKYFRATMWLGRTDLRLIETQPDGSTVFRRQQLNVALAMAAVVQGETRAAYDRLDKAIGAFVGEHDYMQLREVDKLLADLGGAEGVAKKSDEEIAKIIIEKGYGAQRIASQVIYKDDASSDTLPLDRSFALLGQRYVVDSHVFSNVVFDRVPRTKIGDARSLPNPLDVAYAALANPAALPLLSSELSKYEYASYLERTRLLVDAHGEEFWKANLYNLWLATLRAVSPAEGAQEPAKLGKPAVTGTEAWSRRLLNTQLGSWAQLRHDTILYAKQSYSAGVACEFPDAYVDPYPEAFARLEAFAAKGAELAALFPEMQASRVRLYFEQLSQVAARLRTMAEQEKTGVPFDAEQLAFINDAVRSQIVGCAADQVSYSGWYSRLLFTTEKDDMDPTVADVHTDPGDNRPPQVLHVAAGLPRLMVVTRESCSGPRAYAGLAFAYHEIVTGIQRMNDLEWAPKAATAEDVAFMKPILP